jgi:hypothetical protein
VVRQSGSRLRHGPASDTDEARIVDKTTSTTNPMIRKCDTTQSYNVLYMDTQTRCLIIGPSPAPISPNSGATSAVSDVNSSFTSEAFHARHRLTHVAIRPTRRNLQIVLLCSNFTQRKAHQLHATCRVGSIACCFASLDRSCLTHARNSTNHVPRMPIVRGSAGSPAKSCRWRNPSAVNPLPRDLRWLCHLL